MTNQRGLTFLVLIFNSIIIIGGGHGIMPSGMLEVMWVYSFFGGKEYPILFVFSICTIVGQIFLCSSFFMKVPHTVVRMQKFGMICLGIGYILLCTSSMNDVGLIAFVTGIPFIISGGKLLIRTLEYQEK